MIPARVRDRFPDAAEARGELTITVDRADVLETLRLLRDEEGLDFLSDVTCTDWPGRDPRMWVVYHLASLESPDRVRVKVGLPEGDLRVGSVTALFPTADWLEREAFDFFGLTFEGHPNLRRIELPEEWVGHPLRKDEPLGGVLTQFKGAFIPPPDQRGL